MRYRHNLYFDRDVTQALDVLARREGGNKSRVVNDALCAWLGSRAARDVDTMFKARLDLLSRQVGRTERKADKGLQHIGFVLEALMLFVRYELTISASLPESDHAALRRGNERYERFIAQLGRQIAAGGTRLGSEHDEGEGADGDGDRERDEEAAS